MRPTAIGEPTRQSIVTLGPKILALNMRLKHAKMYAKIYEPLYQGTMLFELRAARLSISVSLVMYKYRDKYRILEVLLQSAINHHATPAPPHYRRWPTSTC